MEDFLIYFSGIDNQKLCISIHKELKFFNLATAVPFDIVTKESVMTGDILLVRDKANNIAPYKNPYREKKVGKIKW